MFSPEIYLKACQFAARAYGRQVFSEAVLPHLIHASAVCMELVFCLRYHPELEGNFAIQCALLQGILENTAITPEQLEKEFGKEVVVGVMALSKDESLPNELPTNLRLIAFLRKIKNCRQEIWVVEMANWTVKLQDPLGHWTESLIDHFPEEASAVSIALREACPVLADRLTQKIKDYREI